MNENKDNIIDKALFWLSIPKKDHSSFVVRLLIFWIMMTAILVIDNRQMLGEIAVDKPAPKTIICPRALTIVDKAETESLMESARRNESAVYDSLPDANQKMLEKMDKILIEFSGFYDKCKLQKSGKTTKTLYKEEFPNGFVISESLFVSLMVYEVGIVEDLKISVREGLISLCKREIHDGNLEEIRAEIRRLSIPWTGPINSIYINLLNSCITTNCVINELETLRRKEAAAKRVQPVVKSYQKGQKIVAEGEIVKSDIFNIYVEIQNQLRKNVLLSMIGSMLLLGMFILIGIVYIRLQDVNVFVDDVQYKLIATLCFAFIVAIKIVYGISFDSDKEYLLILFSPLATLVLLLASTVRNTHIVYFVTFWTGSLSFLLTEGSHSWLVALLLGSIGGALSWDVAFNDNEKEKIMRDIIRGTGLNIGVATFFASLAISMISADLFSVSMGNISVYAFCGLANGLISAILANGILPIIESYFSFATPTKLLELSSTESPLLKRLQEEAPGTYAHSVAVANMAAQAASAVGADAILTRVCALYHDIGKIKRPEYFTENQHGVNPHDEKKPTMSAMIITSHVRDGADLARQNKIPHRVIEIMSQHHGTTLVEYFFNKQKALTPDADESQFRYKGFKPQTKEAAILLLADAVEASSRSLDGNLDPSKIKEHVKRIVDHKMKDDNQLEENKLTLGDIDTIEDEFVKVLMAANHKRVKYQNQLAEEAARKEAFEKAVREKAAEMVAAEKAAEKIAQDIPGEAFSTDNSDVVSKQELSSEASAEAPKGE